MHSNEECTSGANKQQIRNGHQSKSAKTDPRQNQVHQLKMTQHQATTRMRRTKSESAGTGSEGMRPRRTASDAQKPKQVDISDPQLQKALKRRWEHVEVTSSNQ